jgi:hypothetical protein
MIPLTKKMLNVDSLSSATRNVNCRHLKKFGEVLGVKDWKVKDAGTIAHKKRVNLQRDKESNSGISKVMRVIMIDDLRKEETENGASTDTKELTVEKVKNALWPKYRRVFGY